VDDLDFILKIHLHPNTRLPLGSSTKYQVWFFKRDSISSLIAIVHFSTSEQEITSW